MIVIVPTSTLLAFSYYARKRGTAMPCRSFEGRRKAEYTDIKTAAHAMA